MFISRMCRQISVPIPPKQTESSHLRDCHHVMQIDQIDFIHLPPQSDDSLRSFQRDISLSVRFARAQQLRAEAAELERERVTELEKVRCPVFFKGWFTRRILGMSDLKHSSFGHVQLLHSVLGDIDLHTPWFQVIFLYKTKRSWNADFVPLLANLHGQVTSKLEKHLDSQVRGWEP